MPNPYLPTWEYIPDGEPKVFDGRVYIYGSHDRFGGNNFCENDYVCWSAPVTDLDAWRCEGVIWRRAMDPLPVTEAAEYMFAPDVVRGGDGRYYLYYGIDLYNRIAVAVCDTPAGEYSFLGEVRYPDGVRYGGREGEVLRFDPGVLHDTDGRTWLYTGFSNTDPWLAEMSARNGYTINGEGAQVVELAPDMLTVISEPKTVAPGKTAAPGTDFEGHEFFEASSIRHFKDKYYFIYSSGLSHELAYAMSDRPDGGFRYCGVLHSNGNIGYHGNEKAEFYFGNNHGSIAEIDGKYYVFGHRHTGKGMYARQGVAELIKMLPNGRFEMAEMTSGGLSGILKAEGEYEAAIACVLHDENGACFVKSGSREERAARAYITQDGEDRESAPGQYIANFHQGTVAGYRYFDLSHPVELAITVCGDARGIAYVSVEQGGEPVCGINIEPSEKKTEYSAKLDPVGKKAAIYFTFSGSGAFDFYDIIFK